MTEKFDNKFHKKYVGGEGEIDISHWTLDILDLERNMVVKRSHEDVLAEYRWYVRDPEATLPEEVLKQLDLLGVI